MSSQYQRGGRRGGGGRGGRYGGGRGGGYGGDRGGGYRVRGRGRGGRDFNGGVSSFPDLHQAIVTVVDDDRQLITGIADVDINSGSVTNLCASLSEVQASSSKAVVRFPARPVAAGVIGETRFVRTNHFPILINPSLKSIYQYNVTVEPESKMETRNRRVMKELGELYKSSDFGNSLLSYDGQKTFYTARRLPFSSSGSKTFKVTLPKNSGFNGEYNVTLSLVAVVDVHNNSAPELLQALDVVLRQTPISRYLPVKRSFYSSSFGKSSIGYGLEACSGFYQSVRPTQSGLSLNIDTSTAVFVENLEVVEMVGLILHSRNRPENRPFSAQEYAKVKKALKGLKVEVTHRGNVRKQCTISDITSEPTDELTFLSDDGTTKHVLQYFHETYGLRLNYTSWPCLQGGKGKANYLPMEVCKIVGGQRYTKGLNSMQTDKLAKHNCQPPKQKERYINEKMLIGGKVNFWTCINFEPDVRDDRVWSFCREVADTCNTQGMQFNVEPVLPPYKPQSPYNARLVQIERDLDALMRKMAKEKPHVKGLDLLIVILPTKNGPLYGEVKRICETKLGVVSQCFLADTVNEKTLSKSKITILANIPSKINTKVGGTNTVIHGKLPKVSDKPTIIFGADVNHPSPGDVWSPSIAAVVASMNYHATKYIPEFSAQAGRKEMIQDLDRMVKAHFRSFFETVKRKPERIIFYRDGVSEGQFEQVLEYELKAIQRAWKEEFNESPVPPITFVVVQKRHHTKLFPDNYNDTTFVNRSGNVAAGTLVDSMICHPSQFDFYLCSHAGILATSRPAHYVVLWDDNKFTADEMQSLSNSLCYIYARCTRSVSYPAPTYYAHLLAFRARMYLGGDSVMDENSLAMDDATHAAETSVRKLPSLCHKLKNCAIYV